MTAPQELREGVRWGAPDVLVALGGGFVLTALLGALAIGVGGYETADEMPLWLFALLALPLQLTAIGVVVHAGERRGTGVVPDFAFGFRAIDVPLGLAGGVALQFGLGFAYLPIADVFGISEDDLRAPADELIDRATSPVGWVALTIMVVVLAPLAEELLYRGLLLRTLQRRFGDALAVVGSAAVFGAIHFQAIQFPVLFALGVILALVVLRTGRLGPAIMVHAGFNLTTVVLLA